MEMKLFLTFCLIYTLCCSSHAAADQDGAVTSRKLLGVFDGMRAVNKVVESHVGNGVKAGQKIGKVVHKQVKEVINADAKIGRAVAKATDKAIQSGEKAVVIGIGEKMNDLANIITAPLVGPGGSKAHHGGSAAAKEAIKTIKAVEHGKQKVSKAIEKAAEERQHAIKKATKQISSTIDHTHSANRRAVNKALSGRA